MLISLPVLLLIAPPNEVPQEPSRADWASIRQAHEAWRYEARPHKTGFEAFNPGQNWRTHFDGNGLLTEPVDETWSWGLELQSVGYEGDLQEFDEPICIASEGSQVRYQWTESLIEWYINDRRGLEHGYTLQERLRGSGASANSPLVLNLSTRGSLQPEVFENGRSLRFLTSDGAVALNYSNLTVFDAEGRVMEAWFECADDMVVIQIIEQEAVYPLTIDPVAQQAYLKASNTGASDDFGFSVAIFGDTVVVGAPGEDSSATGTDGNQSNSGASGSGAVYVFGRSGSTWSQKAYLKASNTGVNDDFGYSVSVSGDTIVVGAPRESSDATGVDGDQSNDNEFRSGAAYVFALNGSTWKQEAYLKASNTDSNDFFGESVSISGDTIVVGAFLEGSSATGVDGNESDNSAFRAGAAYVFSRSGTTWSQDAYLKASNTESDDFFGESVSISGNTIVVGATDEESSATGVDGDQSDNSAFDSGAAYVFVLDGSTWKQNAYLKASNTDVIDSFGESVSISGDTIVVGARKEDSNATGVDGDQSDNSEGNSGAAYVFVLSGTGWVQQAYLKASNPELLDDFGGSVSISGDIIVIGAVDEDSSATGVDGDQTDNSAASSGAVYVFGRSGSTWSQDAYLKASNAGSNDKFASSVSVSGDTIIVGANRESSNATGVGGNQSDNSAFGSGAAYVFEVSPPSPFAGICNGDGGDQMGCTDCPCMNNAPAGTVGGCLNSSGTGSRLMVSGDPSVSLPMASVDDLRFSATNGPPNQLFILNSGDALAPADPMNPCFGLGSGAVGTVFDGLRCAIMGTLRNGGRGADANGEVGVTNNPWGGESNPPGGIAQFFGYTAGTTKYFQCIHRDSAAVNCMTGLNTTQAIEVTFSP